MMETTVDPRKLRTGMVVLHATGDPAVLGRRKEDDSGWWIEGGGGLDDRVFRDGRWKVGSIYDEVRAERGRAHAKHQDTSMEAFMPDDLLRLAILDEEVGEVAKEFNEARHDGRPVDLSRLRKELIQVAAMAVAWADACNV